ncbi:MAG: hypothetical protein KDH94_08265 [Coxiellaceae bacterium]|nr:hypothetical protein [Coxiellaceae bacterium]
MSRQLFTVPAKTIDLAAIAKNVCRRNVGNGESFLSLNGKLVRFSASDKTVYLSALVAELNANYPNVTSLDLTWNQLSADNLAPLQSLKYVKELNLEFNQINGSRPEDRRVLTELSSSHLNIEAYSSSVIVCK